MLGEQGLGLARELERDRDRLARRDGQARAADGQRLGLLLPRLGRLSAADRRRSGLTGHDGPPAGQPMLRPVVTTMIEPLSAAEALPVLSFGALERRLGDRRGRLCRGRDGRRRRRQCRRRRRPAPGSRRASRRRSGSGTCRPRRRCRRRRGRSGRRLAAVGLGALDGRAGVDGVGDAVAVGVRPGELLNVMSLLTARRAAVVGVNVQRIVNMLAWGTVIGTNAEREAAAGPGAGDLPRVRCAASRRSFQPAQRRVRARERRRVVCRVRLVQAPAERARPARRCRGSRTTQPGSSGARRSGWRPSRAAPTDSARSR